MGEKLLRLSEAGRRLAGGDKPLSKATVDRIAEREGWTKVAISPGVVCVPESEVAATIEKRIAEAKTGQLVSAQRAISKLGIAARRRNRAARKVIAPEADRGDPP
jgi:hypothetical protein